MLQGHAFRPAGKNHAPGRKRADERLRRIKRMDFAVHARLPHPAGDELGVLRAEVDYQQLLTVQVAGNGHRQLSG